MVAMVMSNWSDVVFDGVNGYGTSRFEKVRLQRAL